MHYDIDPEGFGPEDYPDFYPGPARQQRSALIRILEIAVVVTLIAEVAQWLWS